MGLIPKFIKIRVKGKSLSVVLGPRRLPITLTGVQSRRQRDPICRILLGVQLGTSLDPHLRFAKERKVHEATSAYQGHGIAINGADPLFATN